MTIRPANPEDILRWPDGTTCYRYELQFFQHLSDDYEVIPLESPEHEILSTSLS